MSEETEGENEGGERDVGASAWVALGRADPRKANRYLDEQTEFIRLQKEHLHEQRQLLLSHLKWRRFDDQIKGALQILLLIVGAAVVTVLGAAIWNANQADGLVVESFTVPPSFAEKGITGEVVADDITEKIADIRSEGVRNSFSNSADVIKARENEIHVEIPETGVSISEAWRYLRSWLGRERHLSGSLRESGDGIVTLTLSLDGKTSSSLTGPASTLPKLEQDAAEQVFEGFDPVNHIVYLLANSRYAEAYQASVRFVAVSKSRILQADSYALWGEATRLATGDLRTGVARERVGIMIYPHLATVRLMAARDLLTLGRDEESLHEAETVLGLKESDQLPNHRGAGFVAVQGEARTSAALLRGDFADASPWWMCGRGCAILSRQLLLEALYKARAHDANTARALIAQSSAAGSQKYGLGTTVPSRVGDVLYFIDADAEDWRGALRAAYDARAQDYAPDGDISRRYQDQVASTGQDPMIAAAYAHLGEFADAHRVVDRTDLDCYPCNRVRGTIDALENKPAAATYWYARAIHDAPSIPFAYSDWGAMLLAKGDTDAAIEKLRAANLKGPHFADPLEMWGEALMLKNRSDLALAKYAEANKYAPNWGRLHLEWGKALFYAGKKDDARKQFAIATGLDLAPADRADLQKWKSRHE